MPRLFIMYHHPAGQIRSIGKTLFDQLQGHRRLEPNLASHLEVVSETLGGFDGDYRQAAARTLPKLLGYVSPLVASQIDMIGLWNITLRACDDTRENVRKAATVAAIDLCSITVRLVSEGSGKFRRFDFWEDDVFRVIGFFR